MPTLNAWTIPRGCSRRRRRDDPTSQALVGDDGVDHLRRARRREPRARGPAGRAPASARATASGSCCRTASTGRSRRSRSMRIGAVLVPLSTLLRPPELLAQLRIASASSHLIVARVASAAARTSTSSSRVAPGARRAHRGAVRRASPRLPSLRRIWTSTTSCPTQPRRPPSIVDALEELGPARRRPGDPVHLGQPRRAEGRDPHARRRAARHGGRARRPLHRRAASGSTSRCRSSGSGGFGGGLLSVLVAGATLLTEAEPEPERTIALPRARARDAVPRLARPGRAHRRPSRVRDRRPVVAAARRASPPCCRPSAGAAARRAARTSSA